MQGAKDARTAGGQTFPSAQFVVATNLGPPFVVLAQAGLRVVPDAGFGRFLAAVHPKKGPVNLGDEMFGQSRRPEGVRPLKLRVGDVIDRWRSDPEATESTASAGFRFEHGQLNVEDAHDCVSALKPEEWKAGCRFRRSFGRDARKHNDPIPVVGIGSLTLIDIAHNSIAGPSARAAGAARTSEDDLSTTMKTKRFKNAWFSGD